jgi:hypothetical protein
MSHEQPNVKRQYPRPVRALLEWIDEHPRTGWYLVVILTVNFALNLMDALDVDPLWFIR